MVGSNRLIMSRLEFVAAWNPKRAIIAHLKFEFVAAASAWTHSPPPSRPCRGQQQRSPRQVASRGRRHRPNTDAVGLFRATQTPLARPHVAKLISWRAAQRTASLHDPPSRLAGSTRKPRQVASLIHSSPASSNSMSASSTCAALTTGARGTGLVFGGASTWSNTWIGQS